MTIYYFSNFEKIDKKTERKLLAYISESRLDQILKYHFRINRLQRIASTIMLQNAIGKSKLEFKFGEYGRPYLERNPYHFSFSYSRNIAICALSKEEIGADVELIRPDYKNFLLASKLVWDKKLLEKIKNKTDFFREWTAFEAYSKLLGVGIIDKNDYFAPSSDTCIENRKLNGYFFSAAFKNNKNSKMDIEFIKIDCLTNISL